MPETPGKSEKSTIELIETVVHSKKNTRQNLLPILCCVDRGVFSEGINLPFQINVIKVDYPHIPVDSNLQIKWRKDCVERKGSIKGDEWLKAKTDSALVQSAGRTCRGKNATGALLCKKLFCFGKHQI